MTEKMQRSGLFTQYLVSCKITCTIYNILQTQIWPLLLFLSLVFHLPNLPPPQPPLPPRNLLKPTPPKPILLQLLKNLHLARPPRNLHSFNTHLPEQQRRTTKNECYPP